MNLFSQHRDKTDLASADFAFHLIRFRSVVDELSSKDPALGGSWFLKGLAESDALQYPAFDGYTPSRQALDQLADRYKRAKEGATKTIGLWNGLASDTEGAAISISIDGSPSMTRRFDLQLNEKDEKSRLGDYRSISSVVAKVAEVYSPSYETFGPREYADKKVFGDRLGVSWMLYLPHVLSYIEVPEARDLIPVVADGQRRGTIIVSVTDEIFDVNKPEHVKLANAIEIRLADRDLLPRYADL
jgi:hypothetical protein